MSDRKTTDDAMDARLRAAARRWQVDQQAPLRLDAELLTSRRHRSPGWAGVALVAAVIALVTVLVTVGSRGDDSGAPADLPSLSTAPASPAPAAPSSVAPSVAATVPWASLPPTRPSLRTPVRGTVPPGQAPYTTPYDAVGVSGDLDLSGRVGETVEFVVLLESARNLPLAPCPDFSVYIGGSSMVRHALSCAGVPFRDRQGRPYLPGDRLVGFRIRVPVPDLPGRQKLLWVIDGPWSAPGQHGVLTITR